MNRLSPPSLPNYHQRRILRPRNLYRCKPHRRVRGRPRSTLQHIANALKRHQTRSSLFSRSCSTIFPETWTLARSSLMRGLCRLKVTLNPPGAAGLSLTTPTCACTRTRSLLQHLILLLRRIVGFLDYLRSHPDMAATASNSRKPKIDYHSLFAILERRRNATRRVLVGSSPLVSLGHILASSLLAETSCSHSNKVWMWLRNGFTKSTFSHGC